jgi:L-lactate dehydrogenase complex protein LldG
MTAARDEVLARIRLALGDAPEPVSIPRGYRHEGDLPRAAVLDLFVDRLVDYKAAVRRCGPASLEETLVSALADRAAVELPASGASPERAEVGTPTGSTADGALPRPAVVVPPGLPWDLPGAVIDDGLTAAELDRLDGVVTACAVAVAETGTIVLDASPDQGRRAITLIPDYHLCVVRASQVVQTVPEAVGRLDPSRPLTWISGPSATSDIELQRVEGVHGPRNLEVVLVED